MARTVASEEARATLVEMAQIWMRLAGTEEGRQVAQQQQQIQPKADDKSRPASRKFAGLNACELAS
jgi:hypothetical protein